jgi:hypothetical protein
MRKALLLLPILVLGLASTAARADQYNFTISGTGISGSGTITVSSTGTPGVDDINGITGTFSNTAVGGFSGSITGLASGSYSASSPTTIPAVPGYIDTFDNLFYPGGSAASCLGNPPGGLLDWCGMTFKVGSNLVNIFGTGTGTYGIFDWTPTTLLNNNTPVNATFTVAAPEPGTLGLLLAGLGVVALLGAVRRRKIQLLPQAA